MPSSPLPLDPDSIAFGGIEPEHFRRWLQLFRATTTRLFASADAAEFDTVARSVAASLQYGFFGEVKVA